MILYANGDSHTAAAEAVNPYAFAEDDGQYFYMGRVAHPDNLTVSWGKLLSLSLRSGFHCAAESASSNARIIRTTREWLVNRTSLQDRSHFEHPWRKALLHCENENNKAFLHKQ